MEKSRKRWRPSLEVYRALEREYGDALEAYARSKESCERMSRELLDAKRRIEELEVQLEVEIGLKESCYRQIEELRSRGFLRRVLNR